MPRSVSGCLAYASIRASSEDGVRANDAASSSYADRRAFHNLDASRSSSGMRDTSSVSAIGGGRRGDEAPSSHRTRVCWMQHVTITASARGD